MCGISGIFRFDGSPVRFDEINRMKSSLAHRGPDDDGIHLSGPVALAHNRLSILDLSPNGHQPMRSRHGGYWIVFNGEVYNFREIRAELEADGHRFHSTGDTEVVLEAYLKWGKGCLERFNGMFAFVIFDEERNEMFAARDRLGIKPFYYYLDEKQFVFGSEIKAVLEAQNVPRSIRREALPELVSFRYLSGNQTLFDSILELEPGHYMEISPLRRRKQKYWDITFDEQDRRSDAEWISGFEEVFSRSTQYQLISDVPVGCALSGGIDSSLVTAFGCQSAISTMQTFSIGFDDPAADERSFASAVARKLDIENHAQVMTEDLFFNNVEKLVWHMDQPINHPNSIGIWLLARLARQRVTVLLTGEGGDELFGGYYRFRTVKKYRRLRTRLPGSHLIARMMPDMGGGGIARGIRELGRDDDALMIWSSAFLPSRHLTRLFGRGAVENAEGPRREILHHAPTSNLLSRHLYLEQKSYLPALLKRADKMTMAVSLECRVPYLDHHVVEYVARMPEHLKTSTDQGKIALQQLAEREFGAELFRRPKSGFGLPSKFFRGNGLGILRDLLQSRSFVNRELVDARGVQHLIDLHDSGREDLSEALWLLAGIEVWARVFIDRQPALMVA